MNYQTEHALQQAHMNDLMPIRSLGLNDNGYYKLKAADGSIRMVAAGSANTAWANAQWPKFGKWAVAWTVGRER